MAQILAQICPLFTPFLLRKAEKYGIIDKDWPFVVRFQPHIEENGLHIVKSWVKNRSIMKENHPQMTPKPEKSTP